MRKNGLFEGCGNSLFNKKNWEQNEKAVFVIFNFINTSILY